MKSFFVSYLSLMKSLDCDWSPAYLQSLIFLRGGRKNMKDQTTPSAQSLTRDVCEPDDGENKARRLLRSLEICFSRKF